MKILSLLCTAAWVSTVAGFCPRPSTLAKTSSLHMTMRNNPNTSENPLESLTKQFGDLFASKKVVQKEEKRPVYPDTVIEPDFRVAGIFLAAGILLDFIPYIQILLGIPVTLLGLLFLIQTFRIKFVFDETTFNLKMGDDLESSGENVIVGGENRWAYDSFVNYDFFPEGWIDQPQGPILVYFKETQTPSDKWEEGPGAKANSEEALAKGAKPGQVHFFPAVCNTKQMREEFRKRGCAKI